MSFAKAGTSHIAIGARSALSEVVAEIENAAKQAGRSEPKILSLKLDVSDEESVASAANQIEKDFGRLDILCNNAGYLESFKRVAESDPTEWWKSYEINVKGVYLCARALIPLMLKGGLKTILNVSSIGANLLTPGASG